MKLFRGIQNDFITKPKQGMDHEGAGNLTSNGSDLDRKNDHGINIGRGAVIQQITFHI